jgi:hypothetical protein
MTRLTGANAGVDVKQATLLGLVDSMPGHVEIAYSNEGPTSRNLVVKINGDAAQVFSLASTGGAELWDRLIIPTTLHNNVGFSIGNEITLSNQNGQDGPNIDVVAFTL